MKRYGPGALWGAFTAESIRFMLSDAHLIALSNHDTIESYATKFFTGLEQIIFKNRAHNSIKKHITLFLLLIAQSLITLI